MSQTAELARVAAPHPGSSIVDGILDSLRAAIVEGVLPPGFRLREIPLSNHFGCSTTPVREALRKLEYEGLVIVYPRRGAEVVAIGEDKLEDLYEIRLLLECYAAGRAATTARPDELARLGEILQRAEKIGASNNLVEVNNVDLEFHTELCRLSRNHVLSELVEQVTRQIIVMRVRADARVEGGPAKAHKYHQAILEAIADKEPDKAEKMMRAHLEWSKDVVITELTRMEAQE